MDSGQSAATGVPFDFWEQAHAATGAINAGSGLPGTQPANFGFNNGTQGQPGNGGGGVLQSLQRTEGGGGGATE